MSKAWHCTDCKRPLQEHKLLVKGESSFGIYPITENGIGGPRPLLFCEPCNVIYSEAWLVEHA